MRSCCSVAARYESFFLLSTKLPCACTKVFLICAKMFHQIDVDNVMRRSVREESFIGNDVHVCLAQLDI